MTTEKARVDAFNAAHPIGTPVKFWPGLREGDGLDSQTRSGAWLVGGHTPVVLIENYAGGIALTHVEPRQSTACSTLTAGDLGARLAELEATVSRVRAVVDPIAQWHVVRYPDCRVCAVLTALEDQS